MELKELRSFCMAARHRSISKAAETLGLGQPTVTTHIKKLEQELGTLLFDRVRRPIQLTLTGATLTRLATPLVDGFDTLVSMTSIAEEEGPVSVASIHDFIPYALLGVVREFLAQFPHVRLKVRSASKQEILELVHQGEVDMGIVAPSEMDPDCEFETLFTYERVLLTPVGHPLLKEPVTTLDQIARYPLIMQARHSYTRTLLEGEFRRKGIPYEIIVELDAMDMVKRYVALGLGVSVGPRLIIEPEDERILGIVSLSTLLPVDQGGILTLKGKTLSAPALNFISVMKSVLAPR